MIFRSDNSNRSILFIIYQTLRYPSAAINVVSKDAYTPYKRVYNFIINNSIIRRGLKKLEINAEYVEPNYYT